MRGPPLPSSPAQVVADDVMIHVQSEFILDPAGNRAGLDLRFGIRRNRQLDRAVHRTQFDD